ncbi:MAG TPA: hypothetical protein VGQ92_01490 [Actinoplanes sp.]|nr:hypothetical protein [Actinoplanes sp.]
MSDSEPTNHVDHADVDPRPAAVSFVTTEHFTLQGARSSTMAEATGRATMALGAVSGGLVALGLIATATNAGTAFYVFGLILLPTLAFVGLVTFDRVLQSGIEDHGYAQRIARAARLLLPVRTRTGRPPARRSGRDMTYVTSLGCRCGIWAPVSLSARPPRRTMKRTGWRRSSWSTRS